MKKSKLFRVLCLALILVMAVSLSACNGGAGKAPETIKIGYVSPFTGPLAEFSQSIEWVVDQALPIINKDGGIYIEEYDKRIPVEIIFADSESDPNKASEVATKLATTDKVDILVGAWTPDTTIPVSAVAEKNGIPALMENSPFESWSEGGPYTWSYALMFTLDPMYDAYVDAWDKVETNKKVGFIFDSNVDGMVISEAMKAVLDRRGYTVVDPGRFPMGTPDYSTMINQFKSEGVEIVVANAVTPDFVKFWQQFHAMDFIPKIMTVGKAIHFESGALAAGEDIAPGLISEIHFDRGYPWDSPLLGMSANEICDKWEAEHEGPYPTTLAYNLTCLEILTELLNTAQTLDKAKLRDTFPLLSGQSTYGQIHFDENHLFETTCVIVQYVPGEKFPLEKEIISNGKFDSVPESTTPIMLIPGSN